MCGITGVMQFRGDARVDPATLRRMCAAMVHRGPDDEGIYTRWFCRDRHAPSQHRRSRNRASASQQRRRHRLDCFQWRNLQPCRIARAVAVAAATNTAPTATRKPSFIFTRNMARLRTAPARHVCLRHLGCAPSAPLHRARPAGHQAALLSTDTRSKLFSAQRSK